MAFSRILVANRGEIAVRIIDACHSMGLEAVLVVSEADRDGLPARLADRAICIGPPHSSDSYLNAAAIVETAVAVQADAVHPGYGYLAESASFAELCEENGLVFVGPSPQVIRLMADKVLVVIGQVRSRTVPLHLGRDEFSQAFLDIHQLSPIACLVSVCRSILPVGVFGNTSMMSMCSGTM